MNLARTLATGIIILVSLFLAMQLLREYAWPQNIVERTPRFTAVGASGSCKSCFPI